MNYMIYMNYLNLIEVFFGKVMFIIVFINKKIKEYCGKDNHLLKIILNLNLQLFITIIKKRVKKMLNLQDNKS